MSWLYFGKVRHRVQEFVVLDLKLKLMRVRLSRKEFAYEAEILVRKKFSWEKVATVRVSDADRIIRLLQEADAYVNAVL